MPSFPCPKPCCTNYVREKGSFCEDHKDEKKVSRHSYYDQHLRDPEAKKFYDSAAWQPDGERTIWANVFSAEQQKYAAEALAPVSEALVTLGGDPLDVTKLADRYAASIRKRAATGESKSLLALLNER